MRRVSGIFLLSFLYLAYKFDFLGSFVFVTLLSIGIAAAARFLVFEKLLVVPQNVAVVVTGVSTGLGYEAALKMAEAGVLVLAGVRKPEDGQRLKEAAGAHKDNIEPVIIDVSEKKLITEGVANITAALEKSGRKLYGLVNNAGSGNLVPLECETWDTQMDIFKINFFGPLELTRQLLPLLRQHKGAFRSRVVFVTSVASLITMPTYGTYSATKAGLDAALDSFRVELRPQGIDVVSILPASYMTPLVTKVFGAARDMWAGDESKMPPNGVIYASRAKRYFEFMIGQQEKLKKVKGEEAVGPKSCAKYYMHALFGRFPPRSLVTPGGAGDGLVAPIFARLPESVLDFAFGFLF